MNILITGVGRRNKGAELMLLAIVDQLKKRMPNAKPVVNPGSGPYEWRAKLGLFQLFDPAKSGYLGWLRRRLFHQGYRERLGMILPEEVDAILDASGYAFGDPWSPDWIENAARQFESYKHLGTRIILMPQAFGPFRSMRVKEASKRILNAADLVFARDSESFEYCRELLPGDRRVRQAPDFTVLLDGALPEQGAGGPGNVAFVPNRQMLTQSDAIVADTYMEMMAMALGRTHSDGFRPFMLVHEENDLELARQIVEKSGIECPILDEPDPLRLKGILGSCVFIVGSRFHGLISALSQGVPCVATGWSHKYRCLLADYGMDARYHLMDKDFKQLKAFLQCVQEERRHRQLVALVDKNGERVARDAIDAWDLVEQAIREE